jgi:hypothetical protein
MSDLPPKRCLPAQTPPEEFDWPPTDEELADCFYSGPPDEQLVERRVEDLQEAVPDGTDVNAKPTMPTGPLTPLETSVGTLALLPTTGSALETSLNERESGGSDDSTTSAVALFSHEVVFEGARTNDWSAEIAHLQALIEALTEKVEWRIPNDTRR